jgi:excisionase family DNA binding protein
MIEVDLPIMNLTPKDVASRYSVSLATVYRWVRKGELPCLRLGPRVLRFSEPELLTWELNLNHQSKRRSWELSHPSKRKTFFSL